MRCEFSANRSTVADIDAHLRQCANEFVPPLHERVDVLAYAGKLKEFAVLCEAWENEKLIGLVAGYCNDSDKKESFISNVSVAPEWQGQGIAATLLNKFCDIAAKRGFAMVGLQVNIHNKKAQAVYEKIGFVAQDICGADLNMTRNL